MKSKKIIHPEIPIYPFPIFLDYSTLDDQKLRKLPLDLFLNHDGYEFEFKNSKYTLQISNTREHPKDVLKLKITSFRGISIGAKHYYGDLALPFVSIFRTGTNIGCFGSGVPNLPREVVLQRTLDEEEISNNPDRYLGYTVGEPVRAFNSLSDIVSRAKFVANTYFPGFKLKVPKNKLYE